MSAIDPTINFIEIHAPINWDEYFMLQALLASFRSKDPSTKVGAVFVDPHNHQISMGYNGFIAGIDESKLPWGRDTSVALEHQKYGYVVHAEANAILHAPQSLNGAKLYVTHFPCNECAKLVAAKKISEVIYLSDKHAHMEMNRIAKKIFDLCGLKVRQLKVSEETIKKVIDYLKGSIKGSCYLLLLLSFLTTAAALAGTPKIALVLDRGGKDDKSFNTAAFKGATLAKEKLGINLKEIEVGDDNLFEPAIKRLTEKKFDLIIAVGVTQAQAVSSVARNNPAQKFAIVDAVVDAPNVTSLIFDEHEGSYLVGYIAGLKSRNGKVGFIGGMDIPLIRRFEMAYVQGAKAAKSNTQTVTNYIGVTGEAWNNPTKAKELAGSQYDRGVDIIFVAAGASNNGAFDAAELKKKFAIGVDSNQNWIKPGLILTSMLKRVDIAVYNVIDDLNRGEFKRGARSYGLKNTGIDWALDDNNKKLFTDADIKQINQVKADITNGKIKVKDYYNEKKK